MTKEQTNVEKLVEYKADKLIGGYKSIEEAVDVLTKEYNEQIKPLKEKMQEILGALGIKMDKEGVKNFPSEYGTAYFTTIKKIKNVDREEFYRWVHEDWDNRKDCLTAHVAKEETVKHLEEMQEKARAEAEAAGELERLDFSEVVVPGLEIEDYRSVHIRKTT
jgi:hypothetical protein